MALENGLLRARVSHTRHRPKVNTFNYSVYYLSFSLNDLKRLGESMLLSLNRWNIFSFFEKDHASPNGTNTDLEKWAQYILASFNVPQADGQIVLVTLPRLFGYVFNPVSFWFCLDKAGDLRAVISEVNNTFGDSHCYISFHDDRRVISQDDILRTEKVLHVSPFIPVTGHYLFRFAYRPNKIGVWIDHYDEDGLLLSTAITGKRQALSTHNLAVAFFACPLLTIKIITLIHYQAIKLWLKGARYCARPTPPVTEVSR
jgi:DUF1365 family protein